MLRITAGSLVTHKAINHAPTDSFPKLSEYDLEEEKLRKLYDQARAQGNRKKKKEYKEKIAELNRLRKSAKREGNKSES
jgi:CRISPR/Cas system CSM-associated protein Csm2 small subunit